MEQRGKLKSKSLTSATPEPVGVRDLGYDLIGRSVAVTGRDITLGLHGGPAQVQVGVLETIRMRKGRVVVVMAMSFRGRPSEMRTVEVLS
jgi:hypothetical protein